LVVDSGVERAGNARRSAFCRGAISSPLDGCFDPDEWPLSVLFVDDVPAPGCGQRGLPFPIRGARRVRGFRTVPISAPACSLSGAFFPGY